MERPRLDQPFITGSVDTPAGTVPVVAAALTWRDRIGGYAVRWGIGRYTYTVDPGLYAVGQPDDRAPVLVTANYKLTFDALRRTLTGRDAWVLALDTRGINVWCAAGKGTFGTEELVRRIGAAGLALIVSHGTVVLPQLGAPGVAAPEIRRRTGFRAIYGPVRAGDVPAYLDAGFKATPEMRRVRFTTYDRLVLVPIEFVTTLKIVAGTAAAAAALGGIGPDWYSVPRAVERAPFAVAVAVATIVAGTLLGPLLLPWLRGRMFAFKGMQAGLLAAIPVVAFAPVSTGWPDVLAAIALILAGASFATMNYTGTSTYTSLHGVEKEMAASMPWQVAGVVLAAALWVYGGWWA
ncbi:MAG: mercury methylation corrinoid protein HgcA [Coriobacteriia bacterium]|nr:mercury methylation corrinoid protein HgcA [Coriobacteriia bacterium]